MVLNIVNWFKETMGEVNNFLDKYYSEPFFWLAVFLVLFAVSMVYITKYANK